MLVQTQETVSKDQCRSSPTLTERHNKTTDFSLQNDHELNQHFINNIMSFTKLVPAVALCSCYFVHMLYNHHISVGEWFNVGEIH